MIFAALGAAFAGCGTLPSTARLHTAVGSSELALSWTQENVYTVWSTFDSTMDASHGQFCFLGGLEPTMDNQLVCLDDTSGELLWRQFSGSHSSIVVTPDAVLVGYNGLAGLRKYGRSGRLVWSRQLQGTGSDYLYVLDEQIQVLTIPERFWILDADGNVLNTIAGEKIFAVRRDQTFSELKGLRATDTSTGRVLWQFDGLDDVLEMAPLFIGDKVFLRTGQEYGSIYALDSSTGKLLWRTGKEIVSNPVYSSSEHVVYALNRDGAVLAFGEENGSPVTQFHFSGGPLVLNGEAQVGSYQLAYDADTRILLIALGDSRQLFAFKAR